MCRFTLRPGSPRRWASIAVLCVPPLFAAGCNHARAKTRFSATASAAVVTPRSASSAPTVQRTPSYRHAAELFAAKDYRGALAAIATLAKLPGLSQTDVQFLQRQRDICLDASGKTGRVRGASSAPSTPTAQNSARSLGDCGPRALAIIADRLGVKADAAQLARTAGTTIRGTNLQGLKRAAHSIGLVAEGVQLDLEALKQLDTPALLWVDGNHFVAVLKTNGDTASVRDPNSEKEEVMETEGLLRRSGGILLKIGHK